MPDEPSTGNSEIAALAQRVATARGKLPLQHDTALVEVLSDAEIAAERELAEWIRAQRRGQRRRAVEDELAAEKRDRRTSAAIRRADEDDARWHRRALAARRRVANQDARLAQLYRRAEWSSRALIGVVILGMVWAGVNVQHNLVPSGDMSDPLYWLSYGIEAMISIPIITIMVVATTAARWGRELPRGKVIVFEAALLGTTIALNTGPHLAAGDLGRAAEYAIAPAMVGVVIWLHAWVAARYAQLIDSVPIVDDTAVPKLRGSYQAEEYRRAVAEREGFALGSNGFGAGDLFQVGHSLESESAVGAETAAAKGGNDPLGVRGETRLTSSSSATAPSSGSEPASTLGRADRPSENDATVPTSADGNGPSSRPTGRPAESDAPIPASADSHPDLSIGRTDQPAESTISTSADDDLPDANRRVFSPTAGSETGPMSASDRAGGEPATDHAPQPSAADAELEADESPNASEDSDTHAPGRSISYAVPLSLLTGGLTEEDDVTPPSHRRNGSSNGRANHAAAQAVPLSQPRLRPINGTGRTNGSGHTTSMWAGSHALNTIAYPQPDAPEATDALSTADAVDLAEQLTLEPEPEPHRPRSTEIILATQRAIAEEDAEDDFDQEPDSAEDEVRMVARSIAEQGLSKLPVEQIADILTLADQSWSGTGIAKEVGVSSSAVARVIDSAHKVRRPYATNG
ncbi:hypothetical protein AB0H49_01605 [Nocardia sp. NPDC050713]|uniref:hypothetical protein n=1 Tax=Nocardia sp. NPDC050713 TaxID=3154511 RepID=UPI00341007EC